MKLLMHNISLILCISKSLSVTTVVPCVTSKCINKSSATKMVDSTLKTESSVPALIEPEVPLPELIRFNNLNSDLTSFSVSKKEFSMCGLPINTSSLEQVFPLPSTSPSPHVASLSREIPGNFWVVLLLPQHPSLLKLIRDRKTQITHPKA